MPKFFEHEQFGEIRFIQQNGEIWFVAVDVCRVLEIDNVSQALTRLDDDELTSFKMISGGQMREMNFVNEFGLYNLILSSRKPEAKKFKRWVTHEVLPSIRKYGYYIAPNQQVIRIEGEKHFRDFKAQYPEGAVEVKRVLFDLEEYDNGEYDVITIHEVVLHSDKLIGGEKGRTLLTS